MTPTQWLSAYEVAKEDPAALVVYESFLAQRMQKVLGVKPQADNWSDNRLVSIGPKSGTRAEVLAVLTPEWQTTKEIAGKTTRGSQAVYNCLRLLDDRGVVEKSTFVVGKNRQAAWRLRE